MKKVTNDIKAIQQKAERPRHSGFHINEGKNLSTATSMGFDFYTFSHWTLPIGPLPQFLKI